MTFEDYLSKSIEQAVNKALVDFKADVIKSIREAVRPEYMNTKELSEYTGWSARTLQHLRDTRQIDFVQHGRKILYPMDAVDEYMRNHRVRKLR